MYYMLSLYLLINALLYLIFGIWCAVAPSWTASAVGLSYINYQGYAEYVAVYGGLEFGIGVFFVICFLKQNLRYAGLVLGLSFYGGLAVFRTLAILTNSSDIGKGWFFYLIEVTFFLWSAVLFKNFPKNISK